MKKTNISLAYPAIASPPTPGCAHLNKYQQNLPNDHETPMGNLKDKKGITGLYPVVLTSAISF